MPPVKMPTSTDWVSTGLATAAQRYAAAVEGSGERGALRTEKHGAPPQRREKERDRERGLRSIY